MQLLCDAISVLGSRHGMLWNPIAGECQLLRFDRFTRMPRFGLRASVEIHGVEYAFPLWDGVAPRGTATGCAAAHDSGASDAGTGAGESTGRARTALPFDFLDQRTTPCTMRLIGIHAASALKVSLTVCTPFRPRDAAFSTTPVLGLQLEAEALPGYFRWERKTQEPSRVRLRLQVVGLDAEPPADGATDAVDLRFDSVRGASYDGMEDVWKETRETLPQTDRLVALSGVIDGAGATREVDLASDEPQSLSLAWCTWSEPVLEVRAQRCPFKYHERFDGLAAVSDWARDHAEELWPNAARVDGVICDNDFPNALNHLLAYTLHSWLANTWWGIRAGAPDPDWFSVWEGSCYFHSTVDVEYTQTPFYLALWPELLRHELMAWPEYAKDGVSTLGEPGRGTRFLSHDTGAHATANGMIYSHEMEVEENTNYLLMAYAHWRRSGDDAVLKTHADTIKAFLAFLLAADTDGVGVPTAGVSNTIDDASPAVQFGREQVYLAVKTMAAFQAGAAMLRHVGDADGAALYQSAADKARARVEADGWLGEHFATLLRRDGDLINPWTHEAIHLEEIPGWDAAHIYTANGLALLDMVGLQTGLDDDRLRADLRNATRRCLREYGCRHSSFDNTRLEATPEMEGLAGLAANPGWISMNLLRDVAGSYRGVDPRHLADRYWEWQVVTNSQEPKLFFETFGGNNLCFYPRGVAAWGLVDALRGRVIDKVGGIDEERLPLGEVRSPRLFDAPWSEPIEP